MTRNPFVVDVLLLPEEVQEEFLEMNADSTMKERWLPSLDIGEILVPTIPCKSVSCLSCFANTCSVFFNLCETGFSALVLIKSKQRNRLAVDSDLTIALAETEPRIDQLVQSMQVFFFFFSFFLMKSNAKVQMSH